MKTTGAIKTLVQGVSTQNPKERIEGQVWAMRNCMPDPVEGAVKRPAVQYIHGVFKPLPSMNFASPLKFRTVSTDAGDFALGTHEGNVILRDLVTGEDLPVEQEAESKTYLAGGITSHANIGEYTVLASNVSPLANEQHLQSTYSSAYITNKVPSGANPTALINRAIVIEVRQGAYAGVYSVKKSDGDAIATYTVPNGSVSADAVNVQPAYIAGQLYTQLQSSIGSTVGGGVLKAVQQQGASVALFFDFVSPNETVGLFVDDGFYNTRLVMTDRFAATPDKLPAVGVEGHVVEIGKSSNADGNYYVRCQHVQGGSSSSALSTETNQLRPCRWVETSKSYLSTGYSVGGVLDASTMPVLMYIRATAKAYVGSGAFIEARVFADTGVHIPVLSWGNRVAGNDSSSPDPSFVGSRITWMGSFQDRLVVLSNGAVSMSRTGDYLNFYRESVIDDLATDPINLSSTSDATDTLVGAALLDKNLIIIGTKTHYAIVGRTAITPTTGALLKTSAFESNPNVPPVSFGNLVYFSSTSDNNADILAIQPSDTTDSTYAYPVSSHVDGYIPSDITSITSSTKLNILFVLSASGVMYCYRTLFNQGERVLSAWFDFTFPTDMKLQCIYVKNTKVHMLFAKVIGDSYLTVVGVLDLDRTGYTGALGHKYLDFWTTGLGSVVTVFDERSRAFSSLQELSLVNLTSGLAEEPAKVAQVGYPFITLPALDFSTTYMMGVPYEMQFSPTMPLPKASNGEVTGVGKLVIGQMKINYTVGAQFNVEVSDKYRATEYQHSARLVGAPYPDATVIADGSFTFPIGSAEPSTKVVIRSSDHYPLVLSSIDWIGQFFKRGATM